MEGLTKRVDGIAVLESWAIDKDPVSIIQRLCNRLAAYEDTGLEPEDLKKAFNETAILKLAAQALSTTPDHLRDLLQAEQDGRLVVLPCKVGDGLWTFCSHAVEQVYSFTVTDISTLNGRTMLNTSRCGVIDARDVGKTAFLTHKEAEKALEAVRDD